MQTRLHLVSMPWADPELPSIQTAALKAFIDGSFGKKVKTHTYSAFASINLERNRGGYTDYFNKYREFEEYAYFLMYFRRFLQNDPRLRRVSIERLLKKINTGDADEFLTLGKLGHLERRTCRYIEQTIVPQLSKRGVNVVGFTLNYYQLYASIYCARYLQDRFSDYKYLFLFGGATVIYPKVADVLKRIGLEGLCVIGEGERKLELIIGEILATPSDQYSGLRKRLAALHEGFYDIQHRTLDLYEAIPKTLLNMQIPIDDLPLPDFDEYYTSLRQVFADRKLHAKYKADTWLALEGTRGCFAKCDFCDVHMSWSGFRKGTPERIVDNVLDLVSKHQSPRVKFMDNVCDTWAERYAEILIERKIRIASFMECRVHHPETFWTKLSLSGVEQVQVGIEALSPTLIQAMSKGTRAKQNLLVQKWLRELGVESLSNLISHHPKSTLGHVQETKQILRLIPHLERLDFSALALLIGTPLDKGLSPDERRAIEERQLFTLPESLDRYFVQKGEYEPPNKWFGKGVLDAWDELIEWEEQFFNTVGKDAFMSSTRYGAEEILIRDGRYGEIKEYHLTGDTARIYDLCHQGATLATLSCETELPPTTVERNIFWLIKKLLLVELDGFYIALALRPRDELIHNCVKHAVADSSPPLRQPRPSLPVYQETQTEGARPS